MLEVHLRKIKVFARLFQKAVGCWGETPTCRPQSAKFFFFQKRRKVGKISQWDILPKETLAGGFLRVAWQRVLFRTRL